MILIAISKRVTLINAIVVDKGNKIKAANNNIQRIET